jgi:hypothetical protein
MSGDLLCRKNCKRYATCWHEKDMPPQSLYVPCFVFRVAQLHKALDLRLRQVRRVVGRGLQHTFRPKLFHFIGQV